MHMADALVSPAVGGVMYACSTVAAGYSIRKVRTENDPRKIPVMGVMGAFVFATQMINFTIPGTGSSGHLCGGMMLSAMLGPEAGFLTMIGVLLIQCLLFADGGILALGANVWNMAFYGCFVGAYIVWKLAMRNGMSKSKITAASILGCIVTLQMGAFSVTLETLASGVTDLPFSVFVATMQPIHLAIGLVEGLITAAVLCFIYEARPELLWGYNWGTNGQMMKLGPVGQRETLNDAAQNIDRTQASGRGKLSFRSTLAVLAVSALTIGGLLSLAASSNPDGLEWSIERITGSTDVAAQGAAYQAADQIQSTTALLPDYAFAGSDSVVGTSFSGIVGALAVVLLCVLCCNLFRFFKQKAK